MARAIYSTQFCQLPGVFGGPYDAYTVPAGYIAVLKTMAITWGDITLSGLDTWFQAQDGTKLWRYTWFVTLASPTNQGGTNYTWGMWVLQEGETLQVEAATGTADFFASGYLLSTP